MRFPLRFSRHATVLFCLAHLVPVQGAAAAVTPVEEQAREKVGKILDQLSAGGREHSQGFSTRQCPRVTPRQWAELLLLRRPVRHELKFAPGCDLQGVVTLKPDQFPVDLKVRNIEGTDRIRAYVQPKITSDLMNARVVIEIVGDQGQVFGKLARELLAFRGRYEVVAGLDGKLKENRGGSIEIERYLGKKVAARVPLLYGN